MIVLPDADVDTAADAAVSAGYGSAGERCMDDQQRKSIERLKKAEQRLIPDWFDYGKVSGLRAR